MQEVVSNLRIMLHMGAEVEGTLPAAKLADLLRAYLKASNVAATALALQQPCRDWPHRL